MTYTVTPASLADLGALAPKLHPALFKGLVVQMERSPTVALRDHDGRAVAVAGLYPMGGHGELFVEIADHVRGGPEAMAVTRALLALMRRLPRGVRIVAAVRAGHEPGRRLARLAGFRREGELCGGLLERFVLE